MKKDEAINYISNIKEVFSDQLTPQEHLALTMAINILSLFNQDDLKNTQSKDGVIFQDRYIALDNNQYIDLAPFLGNKPPFEFEDGDEVTVKFIRKDLPF